MTDCTYIPHGSGWRCSRCGHEQSVTADLRRNCKSSKPVDPRDVLERLVRTEVLGLGDAARQVPAAETERRIACCLACPSFADLVCGELLAEHPNRGEPCAAKARRFLTQRLLGQWLPCESMAESADSAE